MRSVAYGIRRLFREMVSEDHGAADVSGSLLIAARRRQFRRLARRGREPAE